jgi:hypothetical protein
MEWSFWGISETVKVYYTSLDIPVLFKYSFLTRPVVFGAMAGPHLSIPLGKGTIADSEEKDKFNIDTFATFGLTLGAFGGYPVGPGRIVGDLRFLFDFNGLKDSDFTYMKRRALALTVGYEISF